MDTRGLEHAIDRQLSKKASAFGGFDTAQNYGEVATNAAPYFIPFVGSGFMMRDAYKDFKKGHIGRGLWNAALGLGTGIIDGISLFGDWMGLGELGHAGAGAARAAAVASRASKAGKAMKAMSAAHKAVKPIAVSKYYRFGVPVADFGVNMAIGGDNPQNEWTSLTPRERGDYIRQWMKEDMASREAQRAQKSAPAKPVYDEAPPRYGWNYSKGVYERKW